MHRFFVEEQVDPELLKQQGASITLPEKLAHQVRDVLRLTLDERLVLLDNSGEETLCSVRKSGRGEVVVEVLERQRGRNVLGGNEVGLTPGLRVFDMLLPFKIRFLDMR